MNRLSGPAGPRVPGDGDPGRPRSGSTVIVAALPEEMRAVKARLRGRAFFLVTGAGARCARAQLYSLLEGQEVCRLIAIGIAGALSEDLQLGAVVAARVVVTNHTTLPEPDESLLSIALRRPGVTAATLVSVDRLVTTAEARGALQNQTRPSGPAAVDLESAAFASAAAERGIPYLILRAISDTPQEPLPGFLEHCLREDGSVDRRKVLRCILSAPWRLIPLTRLAIRVRICARRLAREVEHLLDAFDEPPPAE